MSKKCLFAIWIALLKLGLRFLNFTIFFFGTVYVCVYVFYLIETVCLLRESLIAC